jgi:hypothetical protein
MNRQRHIGTIVTDVLAVKGLAIVRPDGDSARDIFLHRSTLLGAGLKGLAEGDHRRIADGVGNRACSLDTVYAYVLARYAV